MDLLTPIRKKTVNTAEFRGSGDVLFGGLSEATQADNLESVDLSPWGVAEFDRVCGGLCAGNINLLSAANYDASIAAAGHFLTKGLRSEQRVAIVSLDNPNNMFAKLATYGFHYESALRSERLVYLYYKPTFHHSLSCTTDYRVLFDELQSLTGPVSRIAILNTELLFNLQTETLARESASKLASVSTFDNTTVLGCFVRQNARSHALLESVCNSIMPCYLVVKAKPTRQARHYVIEWRKGPHVYQKSSCKVELVEGKGYVTDAVAQSQIA